MNVTVNGGTVALNKADFCGSGGEGEIYAKGGLAYKLYQDKTKVIPAAKISELAGLSMPTIVKPISLIKDAKGTPIGYTMKFLKNTFVLCQLFTQTFKQQHQVDEANVLDLVKKLRVINQHAHDHNCLIVDENEMNFLLPQSLDDIYAIDVDSWQTPSFRATAIMESIRDRHCKGNKFNEGTDWFAYGILSFQMIIGLHPFKGRHPKLKTLDERMLANVSVFNPDVGVPQACPSLDSIPGAYKDWFKAVFDKGERTPPPLDFQTVVKLVARQVVGGSNNFNIKKLFTFEGDVARYVIVGATKVALTTKGHYLDNVKDNFAVHNPRFAAAPNDNVIVGWLQSGDLKLRNATRGVDIPSILRGEEMMAYDGTIYVKNDDSIYELQLVEMGTNIYPVQKLAATVMDNATRMYEGVALQNLLGSFYATIFPTKGTSYSIRLKELDGYKIVNAKYDAGVLMVVGNKSGKYDNFIMRLDEDFNTYDVRIEKDIQDTELNFVSLPTGVCAHLNAEERLELFKSKKDGGSSTEFDDPVVKGVKLFKSGRQVLFARGNELFSIEKK